MVSQLDNSTHRVEEVPLLNDRGTMTVHVMGEGPAVVFLHGLYGVHNGEFLEHMAQNFTVYAPEYPGTSLGHDQDVFNVDSLHDLILAYDDVFRAMSIDSAFVVGESLGGMIALELAAAFPERISHLACAAPYGLWDEQHPTRNYGEVAVEEWPSLLSSYPESAECRAAFGTDLGGDERTEHFTKLIWSFGVATKFLWPIPDRGLRRRLYRAGMPAMILWGEEDQVIPPAHAEIFSELLPNSTVRSFPSAGHALLLDAAQESAQATAEFFGATTS